MKNKILLIIFLITVIPTVVVYIEHANVEFAAYDKAVSENKKVKTLGEGLLFQGIAAGYIMGTVLVIALPSWRAPYIFLIVGTIAIVILYYLRIYGIPVPGTEVVIRDMSTDWRDVITKIAQQIMVVPLAMMLSAYRDRPSATQR